MLITNDDTITIEDASAGYKGLLVIDRCCRTLKRTRIKMEPVHHWLRRRIDAHVKLCVLALLLERVGWSSNANNPDLGSAESLARSN